MLLKKELKKIPVPKLHINSASKMVWSKNDCYIIRSRIEYKGNILVVAFYSVQYIKDKPVYVLYLSKTEDITLDRSDYYADIGISHAVKQNLENPKEKWRFSSLDKFRICEKHNLYGSEHDYKRICKYLNKPEDSNLALSYIADFQKDCRHEKLKNKKDQRLAIVQQTMKAVSDRLPASTLYWVDAVPLLKSRYCIYNRSTPKKAVGDCTHCKQCVTITDTVPRHKEEGICPNCGSKIIFLSRGRLSQSWFDGSFFTYSQKTKNKKEIVFRFFELKRTFQKSSYLHPETEICERHRIFTDLQGNILQSYLLGSNSHTGTFSWHPTNFRELKGDRRYYYCKGMCHWQLYCCYENQHIYPHNLNYVLKGTAYEKDQSLIRFKKESGDILTLLENLQSEDIREIIEKLGKVGSKKLMLWFMQAENPQGELKKLGMDLSKRQLHQKLGLFKDEYRSFVKYNYSARELACIHFFRQLRLTQHQIKFLTSIKDYVWDVVQDLLKYTSLDKIIFYISSKFEEKNYTENLRLWKDYLVMCEKVEFCLWYPKILYPNDLRNEHDKLVKQIKTIEEKGITKKIARRYRKLHEIYEYEDDNFMLIAPRTYSDIAKEAKALNNCLITSGYYKHHADGEQTLLFLRKKENPKASYFCLCVNNEGKIIQMEGHQEKQYATPYRIKPDKAEKAFLKKWQELKFAKVQNTRFNSLALSVIGKEIIFILCYI